MITLRLAEPGDDHFIKASWFTNYWKNVGRHESYGFPVYRHGMPRLIESLRERSRTLVACLTSSPDEVFGYAVVEPPDICHWVYVKKAYRRRGVATGLLRSTALRFTLETPDGKKLAKSLGLEFNPFALVPMP